jgi:Tol biopolymer transport system component
MVLTKQTENRGQIYYLSYPNYQLTPITNDFNNYTGMLTVTQDSKSIVTTQASYNSSLWGAAYAKPDSVTQLTTGSFIVDGEIGISWSYDGRIIYTALDSSGVVQISVINSDGTNKKQLTAGKPDKYWAAESANGKSIVYMGEGGQIWIMGSNGENPKQLPTSKFVRFPRISSDGKWIIYSSYAGEKHTLFKFDIESAKEMILAVHSTISSSAISPDGRFIAYTHHDGSENTLKIIPSEGGKPIKEFPLKEEVFAWGRIHWTPDGRGIGYILGEENGGNIYVQPVDGSPAYRLTNFKDDDKLYLSNFSWSSDGKQIAYSRGKSNSDIVMIQNLP